MREILIAHECPNCIFEEVRQHTNYLYALVHLLEENETYRNNFLNAKLQGSKIILDNSIFELGEAFDSSKYVSWIQRLEPDEYIVPDSLENAAETIWKFFNFTRNNPKLPGKKIGVLQGKSYDELCNCYKALVELGAEKIAISFDYSFFKESYQHQNFSKWEEFMLGRIQFIDLLIRESFFKEKIPLHLLGCSLPQEFKHYSSFKKGIIESVDTSNPIVHGLFRIPYTSKGTLDSKETKKLCDLIDSEVDSHQKSVIFSNIYSFKENLKIF